MIQRQIWKKCMPELSKAPPTTPIDSKSSFKSMNKSLWRRRSGLKPCRSGISKIYSLWLTRKIKKLELFKSNYSQLIEIWLKKLSRCSRK